jgi:hypothetical protein
MRDQELMNEINSGFCSVLCQGIVLAFTNRDRKVMKNTTTYFTVWQILGALVLPVPSVLEDNIMNRTYDHILPHLSNLSFIITLPHFMPCTLAYNKSKAFP